MSEPTPPQSGLKNPAAAVRGVGAAVLAAEAVVMLLAIVPLRVLGTTNSAATTGALIGFTVLFVVLAGMLRRRWAWLVASIAQVALFAAGFVLHPALAVLGVLFGLAWLYALYVRGRVLR